MSKRETGWITLLSTADKRKTPVLKARKKTSFSKATYYLGAYSILGTQINFIFCSKCILIPLLIKQVFLIFSLLKLAFM